MIENKKSLNLEWEIDKLKIELYHLKNLCYHYSHIVCSLMHNTGFKAKWIDGRYGVVKLKSRNDVKQKRKKSAR